MSPELSLTAIASSNVIILVIASPFAIDVLGTLKLFNNLALFYDLRASKANRITGIAVLCNRRSFHTYELRVATIAHYTYGNRYRTLVESRITIFISAKIAISDLDRAKLYIV